MEGWEHINCIAGALDSPKRKRFWLQLLRSWSIVRHHIPLSIGRILILHDMMDRSLRQSTTHAWCHTNVDRLQAVPGQLCTMTRAIRWARRLWTTIYVCWEAPCAWSEFGEKPMWPSCGVTHHVPPSLAAAWCFLRPLLTTACTLASSWLPAACSKDLHYILSSSTTCGATPTIHACRQRLPDQINVRFTEHVNFQPWASMHACNSAS